MNQETVNFYGDELIVIPTDQGPQVAIKPICDGIGVDSWHQQQRALNDPALNCRQLAAVAADGKTREMLCIPLDRVQAFINGISIEVN